MKRTDIVDLRSDTVTRPTPAMLEAMMRAEVGDDVLGDDPTVLALQNKVAQLLGKEAGLFVPSGTMANQIAVRAHTEAGDEIILEADGHTFLFETGALAGVCGVQAQLLPGKRGLLTADQIERGIRGGDYHLPPTKLIILENTHNQGGGTVQPLSLVQEIRGVALRHGIAMHMDGARLWNACVASGKSPKEYASQFESVSVCLSKGLGAPVGSCIAGTKAFIARARRFRKMFGGGMRQSGILAAAGIYALDHHYERLKEDHENAKYFARELSHIKNVQIDINDVETNLVYFGVEGRTPKWVEEQLHERGVWLFAERPNEVRAVTHLDVDRAGLDRALETIRTIVR
ncbi:MAG: low-specificity L-threonine aldolase [Pseudomonadota bacterium]